MTATPKHPHPLDRIQGWMSVPIAGLSLGAGMAAMGGGWLWTVGWTLVMVGSAVGFWLGLNPSPRLRRTARAVRWAAISQYGFGGLGVVMMAACVAAGAIRQDPFVVFMASVLLGVCFWLLILVDDVHRRNP